MQSSGPTVCQLNWAFKEMFKYLIQLSSDILNQENLLENVNHHLLDTEISQFCFILLLIFVTKF